MIILKGKYNIAKIMLPDEWIWEEYNGERIKGHYKYLDDATKDQIQAFLNHPAFKGESIIIMPDTHYGKGSCVGFTFKLNGYVIPNIVGVDIGCGILSTKYSTNSIDDLHKFDEFIKTNIPSGFNIHQEEQGVPEHFQDELEDWVAFTGQDLNKVLRSVGTLGGGNHFIELGRDENNDIWLTIHSGSRNFGLKIAEYYQSIANAKCKRYFQDFGDLNFIPMDNGGEEYIKAMFMAQEYAIRNRQHIQRIIQDRFIQQSWIKQIDSVHNYIDDEDSIIRKGATPAREGQEVVIPFNMEDGLIIATGKGNKDWNYSAPHGAGRILSRNKAKEELDLDVAKKGMSDAGIYTTSLTEDSLDEAKGAYKDKDLIIEMIKDTVDIVHFVKPIYNFKDSKKKETRK